MDEPAPDAVEFIEDGFIEHYANAQHQKAMPTAYYTGLGAGYFVPDVSDDALIALHFRMQNPGSPTMLTPAMLMTRSQAEQLVDSLRAVLDEVPDHVGEIRP